MAPPVRLLSPLEAAASRISGARYVCSTCRRQFLTPRPQIITHHARRHNSSNPSFTDKLRRKLWGTKDNERPPGLQDPYGTRSQLEEDSGRQNEDLETKEDKVEAQESPAPVNEYVPATSGEDLVDAVEWATADISLEHADFVHPEPFLPKRKLVTRKELMGSLHQAMVELCILETSQFAPEGLYNSPHDDEYLALIKRVRVRLSPESSSTAVVFPNAEVKSQLMKYFEKFGLKEGAKGQNNQGEPVVRTMVEGEAAAEANPHAFLLFPLENSLGLKFHFFKRVSQLTGHRVPDNEISSITNPSRLLKFMLENARQKPHSVAGQLQTESELNSLPNVRISKGPQTMVDRETEIGRWKVIEEELAKRDLPVHRP